MNQAFGKELCITTPELDVIRCRRACFESNGLAYDERGCFSFGFAHAARRSGFLQKEIAKTPETTSVVGMCFERTMLQSGLNAIHGDEDAAANPK